MCDLAAIDAVLQHQIEGPAGKLLTTKGSAVCQYPPLAPNSRGIKFCLQHAHGSELYISPEDMDDGASFLLVDDQLSVLHVVAKRRQAAHPHALLLGSCDLVADAFAGDFPLELGEGEQHVQGKPPHRGRGVELLGDRDEGDAPSVEGFHDLGEVKQRTRQSVDLIDHHDVDLACANIAQEPLQGRAVHRPPGKAAVVVQSRQDHPAFMLLGEDKGRTGFALGIERVEGLLQALLGRFARVNRASHLSGRRSRRLSRLSHCRLRRAGAVRLPAQDRRSEGPTNGHR